MMALYKNNVYIISNFLEFKRTVSDCCFGLFSTLTLDLYCDLKSASYTESHMELPLLNAFESQNSTYA